MSQYQSPGYLARLCREKGSGLGNKGLGIPFPVPRRYRNMDKYVLRQANPLVASVFQSLDIH